MVTAKLKGACKVHSKGRTYWYAWRGGPRLRGQPDTPEFIASYVEAHEAAKLVDSSRVKGLVATYRASVEFRDLAESTKRNWGPWLDRIVVQFGDLRIKQFDRPQIRLDIRRWRDGWRESPRSADYGLQVLSRVMAFAVSEGQLSLNPCTGIPRLYRVNRSELIWSDDDLNALKATASKPIYDAAQLAALTGLRRGDLLRLQWDQIGQTAIELTAAKSVSKASGRPGTRVTIPLYGELREFLASLPRKGKTVLLNTKGETWGTGFSASWNTALKRAHLDARGLHFHDLRGTAATKFYRAELTPREIADVMGWSEVRVERLIDRYVKRDELIQQRIQRIDQAERRKKMQNRRQNSPAENELSVGAGSENRTRDIQLGKLDRSVENQGLSNKTDPSGDLSKQWVTLSSQNHSLAKTLKRGDVATLLELHRWFASGAAARALGRVALTPALVSSAEMIEQELIRRGLPVAAGSALRGLVGGAL